MNVEKLTSKTATMSLGFTCQTEAMKLLTNREIYGQLYRLHRRMAFLQDGFLNPDSLDPGETPWTGGSASPFDAFRMATESLSEELYLRAKTKSHWINLVGEETSAEDFMIGRDEPSVEDQNLLNMASQDDLIFKFDQDRFRKEYLKRLQERRSQKKP